MIFLRNPGKNGVHRESDRTAAYYTIGPASTEGPDDAQPWPRLGGAVASSGRHGPMTRLYVDGPTLVRAVGAAVANLEKHVEEVDSLNVFPVPDGDTGSNMLATMRAALAEAERLPPHQKDLDGVAEALSRGALTGARGNSGVILSQIIRGMTQGADGRRRANGLDLAAGLRHGSEQAYGAVLTPVEGTILTVIRDAADAAESAAGRQPHVEAVLADVIEAAASSVQRTPSLLPVLEDAGVVDSGGQGLYRVLEGMLQVDGDEDAAPVSRATPVLIRDTATIAEAPGHVLERHGAAGHAHDHAAGGVEHGYETEYLLTSSDAAIDVTTLRETIQATGDSVLVAGDERLVRVHVHGARPDLAIAAGLRWGRLGSVSIRDLDDQVAHESTAPGAGSARSASTRAADDPRSLAPGPAEADRAVPAGGPSEARDVALVAIAGADGLAEVLGSLGARVVRPAHGSRPSVGEIAEGILAAGASEVIVLPNDGDAVLAAGHADVLTPMVSVKVIPTRNAAEGIAAAVTYDPAKSLDDNAVRMEAESSSLRTFTVTTAARDSVVDGEEIRQDQVIALDAARHLLARADTVEAAALDALAGFEDFELVTCYWGTGVDPGERQRLRERIEQAGPAVEVEMVRGDQRHDHLLVAVE